MKNQQHKDKKPPRKVDAAYLERAALYYLERFASSAGNLRKVLKRKIDRRCKARGEQAGEFYPLIEPIVERYIASGLLNDTAYAQSQVATLRRRGGSKRMIMAKLKAKGVESGQVATLVEESEVDELQAARNYARRRRLGPWRGKDREKLYSKDMAALARAGFSFANAKAVLADGEDVL